jgi:hypothetical protein
LRHFKNKGPRISRSVETAYWAFLTIAFLGISIGATYVVTQRRAIVTAPGIPNSIIDGLLKASGESTAFKDQTSNRAFVSRLHKLQSLPF